MLMWATAMVCFERRLCEEVRCTSHMVVLQLDLEDGVGSLDILG